MTRFFKDCTASAHEIIAQVGKTIVIGVPVGWGKPIGLLNALYRIAARDPSIKLTIVTGLTFARPQLKQELEKRLVEPLLNRVLKDHEDPLYEKARELGELPSNINVIEFFLVPGKFLHNPYVQQNYISCNYTDAVSHSSVFSINVLAQQVAPAKNKADLLSLSCNTDLFHAMLAQLKEAEKTSKKIAIVAELNAHLPYMYGETAEVTTNLFSHIIDPPQHRSLFSLIREGISAQDYLIGLYASCLIKDGSCLQIGIGKLGTALAQALILRQKENKVFQEVLKQLKVLEKFGQCIAETGSTAVFKQGLYASTEMFSDEYLELYRAGILKKKVYDHSGLQKLLNEDLINEDIKPNYLDILLEHKIINPLISAADFEFMQKFGLLKAELILQKDYIKLPSGELISADLSIAKNKDAIIKNCLGTELKNGKILHAGFFFGSEDLLTQLHSLSPEKLKQIDMVPISRTNSVLWSVELAQLQRQNARLINSSLMIGLAGNAISDGLKDYQEVSGVGGQHDFAIMANQLEGARSVINCHSTRKTKKGIESNIKWNYPSSTLPRYLRDIFITEYGIADCRGKTDAEAIKAILNITDSRFQTQLLKTAKKAGKIAANYEIPELYRDNYPESFEAILKNFENYFSAYPFGSDLTAEEEVLAETLIYLKNCSPTQLALLTIRSLFLFKSDQVFARYLERMKLLKPRSLKDFFYKKLLKLTIHLKAQHL